MAAGGTEIVSVTSDEQAGNGPSGRPSATGDTRLVVFSSNATNLAPIDPGSGGFNVYLRDRAAGMTSLLAVGPGGDPANGPSATPFIARNGSRAVFRSTATVNLGAAERNGKPDIYLRDLRRGTVTRVSEGPGRVEPDQGSAPAAISAGGDFVAYVSPASNIVPSTGAGFLNLFVYDRARKTTTAETVGPTGEPGDQALLPPPATSNFINAGISPDGRYVTFDSTATNLVAGDTNGKRDVFLRDRKAGRTTLISVAYDGGPANGDSFGGLMSDDHRWFLFSSQASNLVRNDNNGQCDIFLRNLRSRRTFLVTRAADGRQTDGCSGQVAITPDGRFSLFRSSATNLIAGVTSPATTPQMYVFDRRSWSTRLVSVNDAGEPSNGDGVELLGLALERRPQSCVRGDRDQPRPERRERHPRGRLMAHGRPGRARPRRQQPRRGRQASRGAQGRTGLALAAAARGRRPRCRTDLSGVTSCVDAKECCSPPPPSCSAPRPRRWPRPRRG